MTVLRAKRCDERIRSCDEPPVIPPATAALIAALRRDLADSNAPKEKRA